MNLLAKSCFAPGLISMISNLIASAGEIDSDGLPEWFKEYSEGMGHEIYRRQIMEEDYHNDIVFKKLAQIAYQEEQAIVFALEIQSKANVNKFIIVTFISVNDGDFSGTCAKDGCRGSSVEHQPSELENEGSHNTLLRALRNEFSFAEFLSIGSNEFMNSVDVPFTFFILC